MSCKMSLTNDVIPPPSTLFVIEHNGREIPMLSLDALSRIWVIQAMDKGVSGKAYEVVIASRSYVAKIVTAHYKRTSKEVYFQHTAHQAGIAPAIRACWRLKWNRDVIVMDLVQSPTLQRCIQNGTCTRIIPILMKCLHHVFTLNLVWGMMHGDLHDKNIMLNTDGSIVFIDYGLSTTYPLALLKSVIADPTECPNNTGLLHKYYPCVFDLTNLLAQFCKASKRCADHRIYKKVVYRNQLFTIAAHLNLYKRVYHRHHRMPTPLEMVREYDLLFS